MVILVLLYLKGKLIGMVLWVFILDVFVVDLIFKIEKLISYKDICVVMKIVVEGLMKGIFGYIEDFVVFIDFIGDFYFSIFDVSVGIEFNFNFFKVVFWYDNEWGYFNWVLDLMLLMVEKEGIVEVRI